MGDGGRKGKTAVVFVHGQGEHVPLGSAPELARTVCATDPDVPVDAAGGSKVRLASDASISDEETPRASVPCKSSVEFFEYYWSDLMTGNQIAHVWRWFRNLIRKTSEETPARILPARQLFIRTAEVGGVFVAAFTLFTVSVSILLADAAKVSAQDFFDTACWSTGGSAPAGWPEGIDALGPDPLSNPGGYDAMLTRIRQETPAIRDGLGMGPPNDFQDQGTCLAPSVGAELFDRPQRESFELLPSEQRVLRAGCATLDRDARASARRVVACLDWNAQVPDELEADVLTASFDAMGTRLVTAGSDSTARIWDATLLDTPESDFDDPQPLLTLAHSQIYGAAYSPNVGAARVITWGYDGYLRLWDAQSGAEIAAKQLAGSVYGAAFSAGGRRVVAWDGAGSVLILDASTGADVSRWRQDAGVWGVAISPNGERVLTWDDSTVRVWDAAKGGELSRQVHEGGVYGATFPADSNSRVLSWDFAGARVWSSDTGAEIARVTPPSGLASVSISPDGARVLTTAYEQSASVWEVRSDAPPPRTLKHDGPVFWAEFSRDGRSVITASEDVDYATAQSYLKVWDAATGAPRADGPTHASFLYDAAFSNDGSAIVTWDSTTAIVWDIASGTELGRRVHPEGLSMATVSADGLRVVSSSGVGTAVVWDQTGGALFELGTGRANKIAREALSALRSSLGSSHAASGDGVENLGGFSQAGGPGFSQIAQADFQSARPGAGDAPETVSAFRYLIAWVRASASESHERGAFRAVLLAPVAIGGLILFVIFSDWLGLARRTAADRPSVVRERFVRRPKWLYFLVMFLATWALVGAYAYISAETGWRSDVQLIAWFVASTVIFGGAAAGALTMLARHLLDAHALRALGSLPSRRRGGRHRLRAWTMLVWAAIWLALGLIQVAPFASAGLSLWSLLLFGLPLALAVVVYFFRRRRLRRQADLESWPFPWHLVQLFMFAIGASLAGGGLASASNGEVSAGASVLFLLAGLAAIVFVFSFTAFLADDRAGPLRHLAFAVVGAVFATAVVWWGIQVASGLPRLGSLIDESGRQAVLVLCGIVALALFLHFVRAALTRAQRSRIMRAFVLPTAIVGGFLYFVYWTVTYLGGQFAEERTIESANEEIETTLALQDVADDSRLASSVRLVDALWRSDELQFLAIRTIYDVRQDYEGVVSTTRPAPPPSVVYSGAAFNSDGVRVLTWGGDDVSRIWDAYTGVELARHQDAVGLFGATFSASGGRVLSWDYTGTWTWDVGSGLDLVRFPHDTAFGAAIHDGSDRVLTWGDDGAVRAWDGATGAPLGMMTHELGASGAAFSTDAGLVLSWDSIGNAVVWETATGAEVARWSGELGVYGAAYSPVGGLVLTWNGAGRASVWDASTGFELASHVHELGIYGAAFSPDGARIVSWGGDGVVRVWDALTGVELARQTHDGGVYGAAFSPDGARVLSWAYADARVWDAATGAERLRFTHTNGVYSAAFDVYGASVITVGDDNEVRLWSAETGEEIRRLPHGSTVYGAMINVYGDRILTWDGGGGAHAWDAFAENAAAPPVTLAVAMAGDTASTQPAVTIACDDLIGDYRLYATCIDDLIFSEQSLVHSLADESASSVTDPFVTAVEDFASAAAPPDPEALARQAHAREVEVDFFNTFLFELKNALGSYSNVGVLQVALIWAGFTILALIWARMLVASLVIAVAVAPLGLLTALGNNVELRLLNVENRLSTDGVLALGESPLRLVNGAYGFFLAFCLSWFIVQIMRELFDLRRVRGLPHLALALSAAFGLASYNAGGGGLGFGAQPAQSDFPLAFVWAATVVGVLGFATWIVAQILRELGARSWWARALPYVLALLVAVAGWASFVTVEPTQGIRIYIPMGGIATVEEIWTVAVVVVLMVVIGGVLYAAQLFLVPIMADSARYLSQKPQNIARRREIVDRGVRLLRAITSSGRYDRIIIVAHSLGTLVAFDALNRWWSHFEENVRRNELRTPRAAVATAAAELSDGVRRGLVSIAEGLAKVGERRRRGARTAKGGELSRAEDARTDEKRVERVCELLSELAAAYEKAGGTVKPGPGRNGDAARPERVVRGREARARAGVALRVAMSHLRAGPASFGRAAQSLRDAAQHVRSVFGADPKSPGGKGLLRRLPASAAATADALDEASDQLGSMARLHDRHLAAQERLAAVLASGPADQRFIVSDLVTLGSPLTHGEYLLGADHRVQTVREDVVAQARPIDALQQRLAVESPAGAPAGAGAAEAGDDGSTFPGVRWTNLFFRGPNLLKGDIVGGPVWPVFGPGVIDVPLDDKPNKAAFAHNEYWKSILEDAILVEQGPPEHIRALRQALRLALGPSLT
jgi:WD40 repeat protein